MDIKQNLLQFAIAVSNLQNKSCRQLKTIAFQNSSKDQKSLILLLADKWPEMIEDFVLRLENSRADTSFKSITVSHKIKKPRYFLLKSKLELAKEFKQALNCAFSVRAIIHEMPQNAIKHNPEDNVRNSSCPVHSNIRRKVKAANKILKRFSLSTLKTSVRG